ncbi:MAG: SIS domain-containing protein [Phycisphaerales bacterium]
MLDAFRSARAALDSLLADAGLCDQAAAVPAMLADRFRAGSKILACGNGGSACDAMHFCEELTGRFRHDRPPLAAIACTDAGHITCTANDYGFERVFSRWVQALGRPGDTLIALSTSGNSLNIVAAIEAARAGGLHTIGLLAQGGGRARGLCDIELVFPGTGSDRIQELHMLVLHAWVEGIELEMGFTPRPKTR